ncbi:hypothetical protein NL676_013927 [Syzygium grande]|nr:hypothetical protein NL676_013927 [Syzygium grande]
MLARSFSVDLTRERALSIPDSADHLCGLVPKHLADLGPHGTTTRHAFPMAAQSTHPGPHVRCRLAFWYHYNVRRCGGLASTRCSRCSCSDAIVMGIRGAASLARRQKGLVKLTFYKPLCQFSRASKMGGG